jgi:hypothetical protein
MCSARNMWHSTASSFSPLLRVDGSFRCRTVHSLHSRRPSVRNAGLHERRMGRERDERRSGHVVVRSGPGESRESRESDLNNQLEKLKEETKAAYATAIDRVKMQATASLGPEGPSAEPSVSSLQYRLQEAIEELSHGLIEREVEVRLLLLAALSQEHLLLLGPPGTAKSELGRRLSKLCQGKYFERLLTRFSVPEELFGPLSMTALERDEYVRQVRVFKDAALLGGGPRASWQLVLACAPAVCCLLLALLLLAACSPAACCLLLAADSFFPFGCRLLGICPPRMWPS